MTIGFFEPWSWLRLIAVFVNHFVIFTNIPRTISLKSENWISVPVKIYTCKSKICNLIFECKEKRSTHHKMNILHFNSVLTTNTISWHNMIYQFNNPCSCKLSRWSLYHRWIHFHINKICTFSIDYHSKKKPISTITNTRWNTWVKIQFFFERLATIRSTFQLVAVWIFTYFPLWCNIT